ncbi:hypothetical protein PFICI_04966 [Pestalotiopsis fici W106-1]|uniref:GST C-terminal domain-containing protein n=1 Tax=Pestalotiopsis fici (strain W106-1 / CGMCC3.15140) TaxID=1229662 RepID=W3XAL0_PESFW|nr:uncharacterized protein PFICI_04966 [Pestalotiopsis fici W106-1]ETS83090.1 hypothetical protein PFICI_04966 [Pestalotiopsis fici W106-1]
MTSSKQTPILYQKSGACSLVPHALLYHLQAPFRAVPMAPDANGKYAAADGSLTHDEYVKRIHPSGYVPALDVGDGTIITEMPAVLNYIVNMAAGVEGGVNQQYADLVGRTALEKAQVLKWLAWLSGTLHAQGFGALFRPARFVGGREDIYPTVQDKGREIIRMAFERINKALTGNQHLVGEHLTVADFNVYVFYRWGVQIGFDMAETYPEYTRVMRKVESLDGFKKAIEVEELKFLL